MLLIFDKNTKTLSASEETDFRSNAIMERQDIEQWIVDFPELLGEELLPITTEYDKFDKTKERLDLLALDKNGKLVLIELKREDSGKTIELQAVKYAAYCSTLTFDKIALMRAKFINKTVDEVEKELDAFIENSDFEELDDKPRIVLVAKDFKPEVTASVLWLRKFNVDISCIRLTPYRIDENRIGIVSHKIIPLPEAEEYIVRAEQKESSEQTRTRTQEEYANFYKELVNSIKHQIPISLVEDNPKPYYPIPTGISNVHFEWCFHGRPRSSFGVELHFEKGSRDANLKLLEEMAKLKAELEKETGETVFIQRDWGRNWARMYIEKNEGKMTEELKKWAVEKMITFYKILQPKLEKIK